MLLIFVACEHDYDELFFHLVWFQTGESPSFASDGENSNHTLAAEKVALSNTVRSSPRVSGNHVISSGNHSSLSQLLAFVSSVMLLVMLCRKKLYTLV